MRPIRLLNTFCKLFFFFFIIFFGSLWLRHTLTGPCYGCAIRRAAFYSI
jgi:hypothetical protein